MSRPLHPTGLMPADYLLARAVLFVVLAVLTLVMSGLPDNPDAEVEFQTTRSMALGEGLAISPQTPEGAGIIAAGFDVRVGSDGRSYSWFGIGQAAVGVPFYWLGRGLGALFTGIERLHGSSAPHYGVGRSEYFAHLLVGWRNPWMGALTAWLLFLTARRLSASRIAATFGALTYALCTYALPQARATLSDVQATTLLFGAFALLIAARDAYLRFERPSPWVLLQLGACLGLAVLTRVATLPAVAVLFLAALWVTARGRRRLWSSPLLKVRPGFFGAAQDISWVALSAGLCALVFLVTNLLRFGSLLETGYGAAVASGNYFSYPPQLGLAGITIAPGKGIFWLAPGVLAAPFGFYQRRNDRLIWVVTSAVSLAVLAPIVATQSFHGGWTFGPRYLLSALPFLWLGTSLALSVALKGRGLGLVLMRVLFGFGFVANVGGVLVDQSTYHDLAGQAARLAWPDAVGASDWERDNARFVQIQWDWRFAAPWACWRILRYRVSHRAAGVTESFPVSEIFMLPGEARITPEHTRDQSFRQLAWVDLEERLDGRPWPALTLALLLGISGLVMISMGLDPTRP